VPTAEEVVERFWNNVSRPSPYCCWEWEGHLSAGYGQFRIGDKQYCAHRLAWKWLVGPIPGGLTIDHLCRNPVCVNPLHLEVVTVRVNVLRGKGLSAQNARKTHCPRGHEFNEESTYLYRNQRHCKPCKRAHTRAWREARRVN
jgi:hypothetical protein